MILIKINNLNLHIKSHINNNYTNSTLKPIISEISIIIIMFKSFGRMTTAN